MSDGNERLSSTVERLLNGDTRTLEVNNKPLQLTGQDEVLRSYTLGGGGRDIRMYLSQADLEHLLEIAKRSSSKRVCLPSAGVQLTVRRSHGGHIYEVLQLVSGQPVPERVPAGISMPVAQHSAWEMLKKRG